MNFILRTCLLLALEQLSFAQDRLPLFSVCEVMSRLTSLHNQMIQIRGIDASTNEGGWISGSSCEGPEIEGKKWKAIIALTVPLEVKDPVHFALDEPSFQRATVEFRVLKQSIPARCIEATYTGLLRTRPDWSKFRLVYPDGRVLVLGFGHMDEAPAELIVKSVDKVAAITGCR